MSHLIRGCAIAALSLALLQAPNLQAAPPGSGWNLVWADEFNDTTVSTSNWNISNGLDWDKNGVKCWFYPANVKENGQNLIIENKWLSNPGPNGELYSGGWITSKQKFTYGYFEAKIRIEWVSQNFWPTFWIWEWRPDGSANEFDIMESAGFNTYPTYSHHYPQKTGKSTSESISPLNEWHTWALLWTPNEVTFYQDGIRKFSSSRPDLAVNDLLPMIFSCSPNRENNPARSGAYPRLFVDWVRVWQGGTPPPAPTGPPIGQTIALVAKGPNKWVSADKFLDSTNWPLAGNRTGVGGWEKFQVIDAGGGAIALKALGNNKFVAADGFLGWNLMANRPNVGGSWEKFEWIQNADATISLRSLGNNKIVTSDRNADPVNWPLDANRNSVGGDWEKFNWEPR